MSGKNTGKWTEMVKIRVIVDELTGEEFMLAFDRDGFLIALEPIEPTHPSVSTAARKHTGEVDRAYTTENIPKIRKHGACDVCGQEGELVYLGGLYICSSNECYKKAVMRAAAFIPKAEQGVHPALQSIDVKPRRNIPKGESHD